MQTIEECGQFLRDWMELLEKRRDALKPVKPVRSYSWCGESIASPRRTPAQVQAQREAEAVWSRERPALSKALSQVRRALLDFECGIYPAEYWPQRIGKFIVPCS
jgi:hypothetical protein